MAERKPRRLASVGAGLHAGKVELAIAEKDGGPRSYRVLLAAGRRVSATLGHGVSNELVEECLREGKTVVLVDGVNGIEIAGALQTQSNIQKDNLGTLALEAKHIRIRADQSLVLEVPGASLSFEPGGALRMEGDKLVIDMAALVRVFAARVELP